MHLWPSLAIRDSFKDSYLKNFEWNLGRMKRDKQSRSYEQKLLGSKGDGAAVNPPGTPSSQNSGFLKDTLMVLSCFYCCFCFGAGDDE